MRTCLGCMAHPDQRRGTERLVSDGRRLGCKRYVAYIDIQQNVVVISREAAVAVGELGGRVARSARSQGTRHSSFQPARMAALPLQGIGRHPRSCSYQGDFTEHGDDLSRLPCRGTAPRQQDRHAVDADHRIERATTATAVEIEGQLEGLPGQPGKQLIVQFLIGGRRNADDFEQIADDAEVAPGHAAIAGVGPATQSGRTSK